ncbi:MAG: hypothetical protein ACE37K_20685 [Planctomycetota bacterium]
MKRFPLLLAALLGVVVSVPAQNRRSGRHHQGQVVTVQPAARGPVQNQAFRQGQPVSGSRSARRGGVDRRATRNVNRGAIRSGRHDGRGVSRRSYGRHDVHRRSFGRWETRCERVLVPGYWDRQHVPAVFGWIYDSCGRRHWGIVTPACYQRVWVPARYETRSRRVWVRH